MFDAPLVDDYKLTALPPEWAARVWPQIEGYIAKALRRGGLERKYNTAGVLADILLGRCHLWIVSRGTLPNLEIDAALTTRRIDYQLCSTLYVQLIGGKNLQKWWDKAETTLDTWAKSLLPFPGAKEGCIGLEGGARKGWGRKPGWKVTGVMLEKEF